MRKEQKIELVNSITAEIKESAGVIITNYKGLTFDQMDEIRRSFKEAGNDYRVIKNTLLKKALNADNITEIDYTLVEPTALVVVKEDFAAAAKLAKKYAKDAAMSKFFAIKGVILMVWHLTRAALKNLLICHPEKNFWRKLSAA